MDWKGQVSISSSSSSPPLIHTYMLCGCSTSGIFCIRWAFIDLTAGPFSWGPAVGGEGVRTELSLPNVQKTIGAVAGTVDSYFT
jgi:hypothetical protein